MEENDKRRAVRKRVLKGATIAFNGRASTMSCTVKDISDTGARLRVSKDVAVPSHFDLIIEMDGLEASCTVAWRRGEEVGVTFDAPPTKGTPRRAQVITSLEKGPSLLRRKP